MNYYSWCIINQTNKLYLSFCNVNVESKVTLTFNICLQVGHLEMIIDPVHNEVWEPRVLSTSLEQFVEKLQALLPEVIAKDFEAHKRLVLREGLSEQGKTHVVCLIISHVQVDKTFV